MPADVCQFLRDSIWFESDDLLMSLTFDNSSKEREKGRIELQRWHDLTDLPMMQVSIYNRPTVLECASQLANGSYILYSMCVYNIYIWVRRNNRAPCKWFRSSCLCVHAFEVHSCSSRPGFFA